jgi:hypothetical protein
MKTGRLRRLRKAFDLPAGSDKSVVRSKGMMAGEIVLDATPEELPVRRITIDRRKS